MDIGETREVREIEPLFEPVPDKQTEEMPEREWKEVPVGPTDPDE